MDIALEENVQHQLGFHLMQFETLCHFNLIKSLIEFFKMDILQPKYGCAAGLNAFIAMGYQLDASIVLYESIKYLRMFSEEESKAFTEQPCYSDLEVVRNNIHTYFKEGGFAEKANTIIENKLKEYKLDKPDIFSKLRNDISLVFHIRDRSRYLIGCDYFISHCIFESKNIIWTEKNYRDYSEFLSSNIKAIALTVDETPYQLSQLCFREQMPIVELFDYKSADLMNCSVVSPVTTFRLILILYQISYALLLVDEIFDYGIISKDDMWSCFFIKMLAIKYDESFDNFQSLLKFSSSEDVKRLHQYCENEKLSFKNLCARKFAQKLRNTLHYQTLLLDVNKIAGTSTKDIVTAIYLSNTETDSMTEYRNKGLEMINEMRLLQRIIRKIISVDKTYFE